MDKKCAFLSKTRTSLSDPKLLNGTVYYCLNFCWSAGRVAAAFSGILLAAKAAATLPAVHIKHDKMQEINKQEQLKDKTT